MTSKNSNAAKIEYGFTAPLDAKAMDDKGMFEGYAATYGHIDEGRDIVAPGAFDETLRVRPAPRVKMLFNHDRDRLVGTWQSMTSDGRGLYVKGQFLLNTTGGKEVYEMAKSGALDSLSIGYRTTEENWNSDKSQRTIIRADLREVSLVTFPMNEQAVITGVKSLVDTIDGLETIADAEKFLREAGAIFSRKEATGFMSRVKRIVQREAEISQEETELKKLLQLLRS